MAFDRKRIKMDTERLLITGFIVSDKFCKDIIPITKPEYFETQWAQTVVQWCIDHFNTYGEAPYMNMPHIFSSKSPELDELDAEPIEELLLRLSEEYAESRETFNDDFYIDRATEYYKRRSIVLIKDNLTELVALNKWDSAELELASFKKIIQSTSEWASGTDTSYIAAMFNKEEEGLIKFPGRLGSFLGPFQRTWLVSVMGPPKRGKSQWLLEMAVQGIFNRLKVAVFSHEMSKKDWMERYYIRLMGRGLEGGTFKYPIFDCAENVSNNCRLAGYRGLGPRYLDSGAFNTKYRPCDVCRTDPRMWSNYKLETWYEEIQKDGITPEEVTKRVKQFESFGRYLKVIDYPQKTANVAKMEHALEMLEYAEGFVPDIIITDYVTIQGLEDKRIVGRDAIDLSMMALKGLAKKRNALVVTGNQGNRGSIEAKQIKQKDTAEDIRIVNHVDVLLGINQTEAEKAMNTMRVSILAHRHRKFLETQTVTVLQYLEHGIIYRESF